MAVEVDALLDYACELDEQEAESDPPEGAYLSGPRATYGSHPVHGGRCHWGGWVSFWIGIRRIVRSDTRASLR